MPIPPAWLLRQTSLAYRQFRHLLIIFGAEIQIIESVEIEVRSSEESKSDLKMTKKAWAFQEEEVSDAP